MLFVHTCSTISQWSPTKGQHKTRLNLTAASSGKHVENVAFCRKSLPTNDLEDDGALSDNIDDDPEWQGNEISDEETETFSTILIDEL